MSEGWEATGLLHMFRESEKALAQTVIYGNDVYCFLWQCQLLQLNGTNSKWTNFEYEALGEWQWQGKTKILCKNLSQYQHPQEIWYGQLWEQILAPCGEKPVTYFVSQGFLKLRNRTPA